MICEPFNRVGVSAPRRPRSREEGRSLVMRRRGLTPDALLAGLARAAAVGVILMLVVLVGVLFVTAWPSIERFGVRFLISSDWRPNELSVPLKDGLGHVVIHDGEVAMKTIPPSFGALPVIYGTLVSSLLALVFAVPLSFGTALFLVRLCPRLLRTPISFMVEFLAAIPSIAYGMWGLFVLAPFLQLHAEPALRASMSWIPWVNTWLFTSTVTQGEQTIARSVPLTGRDMFCGGLVLAIMIVPIITAISRDVLKNVPRAQIEGTLAVGANWWQSSWEMLRYSRAALFGAVMLGLARAAGETMAITMVIGNNSQIHPSLFAPAQTMSSLLANEFAEASTVIHRAALTEVALILLVMSLVFNIVARRLVVGDGTPGAAAH